MQEASEIAHVWVNPNNSIFEKLLYNLISRKSQINRESSRFVFTFLELRRFLEALVG